MARPSRLQSQTISALLALGVTRLRSCLHAGTFGFTCLGSDGQPRFSHNKGHVFTASFIAQGLGDDLNELDRTMLVVRALSEEWQGLWGFSPQAPFVSPHHQVFIVDADDTAYVIRMLRQLGVHRPVEPLLQFHRAADRLFVTFNEPGRTSLVMDRTPANNLKAHSEVNANVFLALAGTAFEQHAHWPLARQAQAEDGHWDAYFYPSRFFATSLWLEALRSQADMADVRARAVEFLRSTQNDDGSWGSPADAYETALATNALFMADAGREVVAPGVNALVDMAVDGTWRTDLPIWEFQDTASDMWRAYDVHGALASALAILALRRARRLGL